MIASPEQLAAGANDIVDAMDPAERAKIDIIAQGIFCQMKFLGLVPHWPELVGELNATHGGMCRHLALHARNMVRGFEA